MVLSRLKSATSCLSFRFCSGRCICSSASAESLHPDPGLLATIYTTAISLVRLDQDSGGRPDANRYAPLVAQGSGRRYICCAPKAFIPESLLEGL